MFAMLADCQHQTYMILDHKTMYRDQLPRGIIVRCQPKGYVTNRALVGSSVEQNDGVLLRKWGMLVLDASRTKDHSYWWLHEYGPSCHIWGDNLTTGVLHVVVNKPFKDHLKQLCSDWLLIGDHALTL
jgi:hypothetical protein